MRQDLIIQVQHSPFGHRISGPDLDRVVYAQDSDQEAVVRSGGEQLWSSADLDVYVVPVANGVEIKIVNKRRVAPAAEALAKAA